MRRCLCIVSSVCVFAFLAACASVTRRADQLFERGDLAGAAEAYQSAAAQSRSGLSQRALFREAQAWGLPSTPGRDVARAEGVLGELLRRFPSGDLAAAARVFLACLQAERKSAAELEEAKASLREARIALEAARARGDALETSATEREAELARLQARTAEQERTIHRLQEELEQLKRIDLGRSR
jgi:hypothetical protein